jgi:hypothetical protein
VGQVVYREDEGLGEPAIVLLMLLSVLSDFFQNLPVGVRRCDLAFDLAGVKLPLVLEHVEFLRALLGINDGYFLTFL